MPEIASRKRFRTRIVLIAIIPLTVALYIGVHFTLMRGAVSRGSTAGRSGVWATRN